MEDGHEENKRDAEDNTSKEEDIEVIEIERPEVIEIRKEEDVYIERHDPDGDTHDHVHPAQETEGHYQETDQDKNEETEEIRDLNANIENTAEEPHENTEQHIDIQVAQNTTVAKNGARAEEELGDFISLEPGGTSEKPETTTSDSICVENTEAVGEDVDVEVKVEEEPKEATEEIHQHPPQSNNTPENDKKRKREEETDTPATDSKKPRTEEKVPSSTLSTLNNPQSTQALPPPLKPVDPALERAFHFFDMYRSGYFRETDLTRMIHNLGLQISKKHLEDIIKKTWGQTPPAGRLLYRKVIEIPEKHKDI
eukprot:TRINITY_DN4339_c0_g1_i1.p1 TRINITY_DN4339_c0_g1~~TRINITY_DN4339_c0_g1_i1.p1  ORF type:complete len:311 (-),score=126.22 TRINITY_DN4339_c0_g1_i1:4-936(-)